VPHANMEPRERGGFDEGMLRVWLDGMTTTTKAERPMTRQRRLAAALRDNLRRRKAQARDRDTNANPPPAPEPECRDTREESETHR
jgi:hypothetical protein